MVKTIAGTSLILLLLAGCGRVEEVQDGSTIDQPSTPAANCIGLSENAYGCYGSDTVFHGTKVVEGTWSVYTQSNVENVGNDIFYDRYQRGYDFREDGSAFMREQTGDYNYFREWGANDEGTKLTLSDGKSYTYKAVFANDSNCFEVTREDKSTVKLCNESSVEYDGENVAGYYGSKVTFGNLTHYYIDAAGTWKIAPYDSSNGGEESTVTLDTNGTTSGGGMWGVSLDGKVMSIDGISYLVYQYLSPSSDQCIAVFELSGGAITSTTWKFCKQ